jgi:predicted phosphoadenosine phosphosulfate sulfurtransferase
METSGMFDGRHHWSDEKLFSKTKDYIENFLKFKNPTDEDVWKICLLMNPAKGIKSSKKRDKLN